MGMGDYIQKGVKRQGRLPLGCWVPFGSPLCLGAVKRTIAIFCAHRISQIYNLTYLGEISFKK